MHTPEQSATALGALVCSIWLAFLLGWLVTKSRIVSETVEWFRRQTIPVRVLAVCILLAVVAIGANETASAASPLRMWLNDDDDSGAIQEDSDGDIPGASSPDGGNDVVDGLSDLEDFFPVHLDLGEALETIASIPGVDSSKVAVRLSCDGAELGCVETDFSAQTAGRHLSRAAGCKVHLAAGLEPRRWAGDLRSLELRFLCLYW